MAEAIQEDKDAKSALENEQKALENDPKIQKKAVEQYEAALRALKNPDGSYSAE